MWPDLCRMATTRHERLASRLCEGAWIVQSVYRPATGSKTDRPVFKSRYDQKFSLLHIVQTRDSGRLTYHNPQMTKTENISIPLQDLSEYHQWMTSQDIYLKQMYLLLHIIESRL
jgi:hypothetical protein